MKESRQPKTSVRDAVSTAALATRKENSKMDHAYEYYTAIITSISIATVDDYYYDYYY